MFKFRVVKILSVLATFLSVPAVQVGNNTTPDLMPNLKEGCIVREMAKLKAVLL